MLTNNILLFYVIGMAIAFIFGCIEAYKEEKAGKDISEFPGAIAVIALTSWLYIGILLYRLYKHKYIWNDK